MAEEFLGGADIAGGVEGIGSGGVAQVMGSTHGDVVLFCGVFQGFADGGNRLPGQGVGEDIAALFFIGLEKVKAFLGKDAVALNFCFSRGDEAAAIVPA